MKSLWIAAITACALTVASACQDSANANANTSAGPDFNAPGASEPSAKSVAAGLVGTDVIAELNKSVDVKKVKLGDEVRATVTQDVLAHGKIVIRRGSKLVGHITQNQVRNKEEQESRLGVVFDQAQLKGGGEIDFIAAVRALAPAVRASSVDKPDPMGPPQVGGMGSASSNGPQTMGGGMSNGRGMNSGNMSTRSTGNVQNQAAQAALIAAASPGKDPTSEYALMGGGSRGVFGIPGLHLAPDGKGGQGSVISSTSHNVKLDGGTQMVIQVNNVAR